MLPRKTVFKFLPLLALALFLAGCAAAGSNDKESGKTSNNFVSISRTPSVGLAAGQLYKQDSKLSTINLRRSDGSPRQAYVYSPGQIIRDGNQLIFSEYWVDQKTSNKRDVIVYPLGGSIRSLDPGQSIKTIFRSKRLDGSKRPVRGIVLNGQDEIIFSRGEAIWSFNRKTGDYAALAGSLDQPGLINGAGSKARFSHPQSFALHGKTLYISDRDNYAVRALDLESGKARTVAELEYKPQSLAIVGDRLWLSGQNVASISLNCRQNCPVASKPLWFSNNVQSKALTTDEQGNLITASRQGLFRFNPKSNTSERLISPDQGGVNNEAGAVALSALFDAGGAAVLDDTLYYANGTLIGQVKLPAEGK